LVNFALQNATRDGAQITYAAICFQMRFLNNAPEEHHVGGSKCEDV